MAEETKAQETKTEGQQQEGKEGIKQEPQVNVEQIKNEAVSAYLKNLGYEDESLREVLKKHKEDEDAKKTDLQKANDTLTETTRQLSEERKARQLAEAKLEAIKLGARPDLVDDLVLIASAKATKDKSVSAVIAEMKEGNTSKVYFVSEEEKEEEGKKKKGQGTNITRKQPEQNKGKEKEKEEQEKEDKGSGESKNEGTIAHRILANRKIKKPYYWGKE